MKNSFKNLFIFLLLGTGLFFTFLMGKIVIPYFSFRYDYDFLLTKQSILHLKYWRWAFYVHISSSLVVLLIGLLQFIKPILLRFPQTHRLLGKIYVLFILILCAPSGLVMSFHANGGMGAIVSFLIISPLWWWFTFKAYRHIKNREVKHHYQFMIRSYALTLSAITFRLYVLILPYFTNLHGKEMYVFVSWLSWIPNLLIAELLIKKMRFYDGLMK